jgi:hypothetical protein
MGRGSLVNRGGCARGKPAELAATVPGCAAGSHGRSRASAAEKSCSSHHSRSEPDREPSPARTQTQSVASPRACSASASCRANRSLSPVSGATRMSLRPRTRGPRSPRIHSTAFKPWLSNQHASSARPSRIVHSASVLLSSPERLSAVSASLSLGVLVGIPDDRLAFISALLNRPDASRLLPLLLYYAAIGREFLRNDFI